MVTPDEAADFNPADAIRLPPSGGRRPLRTRLLVAVSSLSAAALGAAPHVLHHAGPLAGAAVLGGAAGSALFGVIGFVLAVPLLLRLRRRTGGWRAPAGLLALFLVVFAFSTFVVGPALSDDTDGPSRETPAEHREHHP